MTEPLSSAEKPSAQPWYAIRTFNCQERKVSRFLSEQRWAHFIPMTMVKRILTREDGTEEVKKELMPAIHNLLFVQKQGSEQEMMKVLATCLTPLSIFRRPGETQWCEITDRDMDEIRRLCDPQCETSVFMTQGEAEAMIGKEVRVIAGPFKGTTGKLVRKQKQYYLLKSIIGMGVMVRVSRWCCEPV